ncbi:hypothetical protein C2G38_2234593 [Gigaspora rosea]|uniref:MD-2-related lipid-recognition domain-containing protein n=1 Tax=Gigaspora rosea TaxID=44941 RepID=A0A397TUI6_9GLOM|nr:hypothetical protein C2G38_2234593 [Gigaspora rosea]
MKNFIFVSILLALLLTVNAAPFQLNKRVLNFHACLTHGPPYDVLNVRAVPRSPVSGVNVSFTVSGSLTQHVITRHRTLLEIWYQDDVTGDRIPGGTYQEYFTNSANPFTISANVLTPHLPRPRQTTLFVVVGEHSQAHLIPFGCAQSLVDARPGR